MSVLQHSKGLIVMASPIESWIMIWSVFTGFRMYFYQEFFKSSAAENHLKQCYSTVLAFKRMFGLSCTNFVYFIRYVKHLCNWSVFI